MTEDELLHSLKKDAGHIIFKINALAYEMKDDRNDGWVQEHYRNTLKEIEKHIKKVME